MYNLPVTSGFYVSEIPTVSDKTCLNWIPITIQTQGLAQEALLDRKGLTQFATLSGEHRGAIDFNGVYITVNGTTVSSIDSSGTVTTISGSITGSGRLSMAKNDDYVVFVNNLGEGFYYDASTVTKITDSDFLSASTVCFIDGYFVFSALDGTRFFLSDINDPSTFSALDRSTAEERPDPIVAVYNYRNTLHVLGTETIEKYNNIGGISFPFQRINGASNSVGCYSKFSPIEVENSFAFIGGGQNEGAQVYVMSGGSAQAISTPAIDLVLQKFTSAELADAYTMVYQQNGQHLLLITIESDVIDDRTLGYNIISGKWFELSSGSGAWRGKSIIKLYDKFLVGDDANRVGYIDSVYTDYGSTYFREVATQPFLSQEGENFKIGKIEVWVESGVGSATVDPQLMMDYSETLGRTWGTETSRGLGKVGQYNNRLVWRKQGFSTRDRVYRFKYADAYKCNLMKLTAK